MSEAGRRGVSRALVYMYFAFFSAVAVLALVTFPWLRLGGSFDYLLWVGPGFAWSAAFLVVLAILILSNRDQFGRTVSARKWILLCAGATVLGVLSFMWIFSATFCVVCI